MKRRSIKLELSFEEATILQRVLDTAVVEQDDEADVLNALTDALVDLYPHDECRCRIVASIHTTANDACVQEVRMISSACKLHGHLVQTAQEASGMRVA